MSKSKKADKAFIKKIQTITVGTGAKPTDNCGNCGQPLGEHKLIPVAMIPIPLSALRPPKEQPAPKHDEEVAFSA